MLVYLIAILVLDAFLAYYSWQIASYVREEYIPVKGADLVLFYMLVELIIVSTKNALAPFNSEQ